MHMIGPRVNELGISQYLCRALMHWSRRTDNFEKKYRELPLGSKIVGLDIRTNIADMDISFQQNDSFGKSLLSLESLWLASERLPMTPCMHMSGLRYEKQLSLQVGLVSPMTKAEVKCRYSSPKHQYQHHYTTNPKCFFISRL